MLGALIRNAKGRYDSTESRMDGGVSTVINRKRCAGSVSIFRPIIKNFTLISLIAFSLFSCNFGKGKISVEINWPEKTLVNPSLSVTAQSAGGQAEEYTNKDGKELVISQIEAGNYSLIIRLKDGETVVWEKTVSCVVDGAITTKIRYTITEADFTDFALYRPEIIVTELGGDRYKIEILSVNYKGDICYTVSQPAEDPTAASPKYTTPFEIDYTAEQGKVLTARVFYKDFDPSEPAVLYLTKVGTPAVQDTTAHRLNDKLTFSVTSSDTQAKYYYTLDGTVPNAVSSQTNGVIELTKPAIITVKGFKENYLMSDSVVHPVERLPKPVFGAVTENPDGTTYTVIIDYGNEAEAMFLTKDRNPVTPENCPADTAIDLTGNPQYTVSDLTPEQTLKTRSVAVNFFASEEAVLESRAAEKPVITDARAGKATWADPLAVVFTSPEPGAILRYTFDGSNPTEKSPASESGVAVSVPVPTAGSETEVIVRSYVSGKYPSSPVSVKTVKATAPQAVSLSYWNQVNITDSSGIDETEKKTRRLFFRVKDSQAWLPSDGDTYLDHVTVKTTVEAVGGSEFYFPSSSIEKTFDILAKPTVADVRATTPDPTKGAAYLDPLRVALSSNGEAADAVKYYYTVDDTDPTRTSSTEAADPGAVPVGKTETLKAVATGLNRLTSEVSDPVDGTPLNPPKLSVDDTGVVTIAAADADQSVTDIVFYYRIDEDKSFTSTDSGTLYDSSNPPQLTSVQKLYAVSGAPLRNPSAVRQLSADKAEIAVQDARGGNYYKPLSVTFDGVNPGESVTVTDGTGTMTWAAGAPPLDISSMKAAIKYVLVSDSRYSDEKSFDPTGLAAPAITLEGGKIKMTHVDTGLAIWYAVGESTATAVNVEVYTTPFTPSGADKIYGAAGAELKHPAETEFTPTLPKAETPSVTDSRTSTADYLKPAFTDNPKSFDLIIQTPTDGSTVYVTPPGGKEEPVAAGKVTADKEGTYRFSAKGTGLLDSDPLEIEVKQLNKPVMNFTDGKVTLISDGNTILYNHGTDPVADVTAGATEYVGPFDAVGGEIVKAVAVGEFCFASEQMTETIPNNEPLSIWFERGGKPINSQYLSEAIDVTICVPAEYETTRTIRYALKTKNEPAPGEAEYVPYTVGTPISIDASSDLYAQVLDTTGTSVEQSATLKIRLQCPHPNPILEVNDDKTGYLLSFTSLNDPQFEIKVSINGTGEITYDETPIAINSGNTYSAKTSRAGWEDSGTVGGTVPEILKKKGLNN
ncbi:MAG: hypothetical protein SOZ27_05630 [Spirochaetia bacterium]|nr:hypothetical protein [Spirochaetia bacterium]